jgi:uncharacterized protein (TIGR02996 family)
LQPTESDWHARILDAPGDLHLRIVFADWLIARDDPRGRYLQLEARILLEPDHPDRRRWRRAANVLLREHQAAWEAGLRVTWRGGLIERARVTTAAELDRLATIAPALQLLEVWDHRAWDADIAENPVWARIGAVDARGQLGAVRQAAERGALRRLQRVRLDCHPRSGTQARHAAAALRSLATGRAPTLTELVAIRALPEALAGLEGGTHPLEVLDVYDGQVSPALIEALCRGPLLDGVRVLGFGRTGLDVDALLALVRSGRLAAVERLDIRNNRLRPASAWVPSLLHAAPRLRSLELMSAGLGDALHLLIEHHDRVPHLEELSLQGCKLTDDLVVRLLRSPLGRRLRALNLRRNDLTDALAPEVARLDGPASLVLVNFEGNDALRRPALLALAAAPYLSSATVTGGDMVPVGIGRPTTHERHGVWLASTAYEDASVIPPR